MKKLTRNRKGTAEIIGTLLAIVILIFFFTNVYLWHDTATKDANQVYLEKINSMFSIKQLNGTVIEVTAGGSDIALSRLWINDDTTNMHYYAELNNVPVAAEAFFTITFVVNTNAPGSQLSVTSQKNGVFVGYPPSPGDAVRCTVINTLGVPESTTFTSS